MGHLSDMTPDTTLKSLSSNEFFYNSIWLRKETNPVDHHTNPTCFHPTISQIMNPSCTTTHPTHWRCNDEDVCIVIVLLTVVTSLQYQLSLIITQHTIHIQGQIRIPVGYKTVHGDVETFTHRVYSASVTLDACDQLSPLSIPPSLYYEWGVLHCFQRNCRYEQFTTMSLNSWWRWSWQYH